MAPTAADVLIDTIHDWGVDVVFGLPGDGINGIMEALRKRRDEIRFIQVRHERNVRPVASSLSPASEARKHRRSPRRAQVPVLPMPDREPSRRSLAKGEPNRKKVALTVLEDKVKELV